MPKRRKEKLLDSFYDNEEIQLSPTLAASAPQPPPPPPPPPPALPAAPAAAAALHAPAAAGASAPAAASSSPGPSSSAATAAAATAAAAAAVLGPVLLLLLLLALFAALRSACAARALARLAARGAHPPPARLAGAHAARHLQHWDAELRASALLGAPPARLRAAAAAALASLQPVLARMQAEAEACAASEAAAAPESFEGLLDALDACCSAGARALPAAGAGAGAGALAPLGAALAWAASSSGGGARGAAGFERLLEGAARVRACVRERVRAGAANADGLPFAQHLALLRANAALAARLGLSRGEVAAAEALGAELSAWASARDALASEYDWHRQLLLGHDAMARGGWGHWAAPPHAPLPLLLLPGVGNSSSSQGARLALQLEEGQAECGEGREGAPAANPALQQPCGDADGSSSSSSSSSGGGGGASASALAVLQEFVRQCQQERLPRALHLEGAAREACSSRLVCSERETLRVGAEALVRDLAARVLAARLPGTGRVPATAAELAAWVGADGGAGGSSGGGAGAMVSSGGGSSSSSGSSSSGGSSSSSSSSSLASYSTSSSSLAAGAQGGDVHGLLSSAVAAGVAGVVAALAAGERGSSQRHSATLGALGRIERSGGAVVSAVAELAAAGAARDAAAHEAAAGAAHWAHLCGALRCACLAGAASALLAAQGALGGALQALLPGAECMYWPSLLTLLTSASSALGSLASGGGGGGSGGGGGGGGGSSWWPSWGSLTSFSLSGSLSALQARLAAAWVGLGCEAGWAARALLAYWCVALLGSLGAVVGLLLHPLLLALGGAWLALRYRWRGLAVAALLVLPSLAGYGVARGGCGGGGGGGLVGSSSSSPWQRQAALGAWYAAAAVGGAGAGAVAAGLGPLDLWRACWAALQGAA